MIKHVLVLNDSGFPGDFLNVEIYGLNDQIKIFNIESSIIQKLNEYNCKFNIMYIEYNRIQDYYENLNISKYFGIIQSEEEILESETEHYENKGYLVINRNNVQIARRNISYVFMSSPIEGGRNTLFSQSIFPDVIDFLKYSESTPNYNIMNLPIYFLNIINKEITAPSLIRRIANLKMIDMIYIEIFMDSFSNNSFSKEMRNYIEMYYSDRGRLNQFENDFFRIDFNNKIVKIKTTNLNVGSYIEQIGNTQKVQFKGSSEKFYWMEVLQIVEAAKINRYHIDDKDLIDFINTFTVRFRKTDDKFKRFTYLKNYIKKVNVY